MAKDSLQDGFADALAEKCISYFQIRREHIWKENDILYPMANRFFSEDNHQSVSSAVESLDLNYYGEHARKKYRIMLQEIEQAGEKSKLLLENLSYKQIHNIFESLPVEITYVDAKDSVAYFNRLDKEKIFVRTRSVIGRKVEKCHPEKSVDKVLEIVNGFKDGSLDEAEFRLDFMGKKVYIQYFPVRDEEGNYDGVVEITQDISRIQTLGGQKLLL